MTDFQIFMMGVVVMAIALGGTVATSDGGVRRRRSARDCTTELTKDQQSDISDSGRTLFTRIFGEISHARDSHVSYRKHVSSNERTFAHSHDAIP